MIRRFNFGGPLRSTLGIVWALIVGFVLGEEPIIAAHRAPPSATVCLVPAGRSPLVQPGETVLTPLAAPRLQAEKDLGGGGPPEAVVRWNEARQYVGKVVTVEGKIVKTGAFRSRKGGQIYFLNFVEQWRDEFYVVIFDQALGTWPRTPDEYFVGATIRVTGTVTLHRQVRPQIAVRRADQIEIVPSTPRDP